MPTKNYFTQDENMLKLIQNDSDLQKKCEMCNFLFSSMILMKNYVQMKHEQELKKAFSKEAMSLVPFHRNYSVVAVGLVCPRTEEQISVPIAV